MQNYSLTHLSDSSLDRALESAAREDSRATAWLLAHIAESDARRRYAPAGYPSMFEYCVRHLGFSEDAAYTRIRVARAARRFPVIFLLIAEARLHLTGARLLAPYLTTGNAAELLEAATHRSKTEIEQLLACRFPRADVSELVSALPPVPARTMEEMHTQLVPEPVGMTESGQDLRPLTSENGSIAPASVALAPEPHPRVTPLAPERYAIQCTVSQRTHQNLQKARELLRHQLPDGSLEAVLDRALELLVRELEKRKCAATAKPRAAKPNLSTPSRYIPAAVKRTVWKRDRGQCTFVSETGRRCESRGHLEFDHELPVARGGRSTAGNLRLRCRAHNQYEAERTYGAEFMRARRATVLERRPGTGPRSAERAAANRTHAHA